ncbi:MAG: DUF5686 family protein [Gemmatimonadales bacterium]
MKPKLLFGIGSLCLVLAAAPRDIVAQEVAATSPRVTVSGIVYDTLSGKPVPFAIVRVVQTDSSTLTDRRGRYEVRLNVGNWRLEFRQIGYQLASETITITGERAELDVYMSPLAVALAPVLITDTAESRATRIIRRAIGRKNDVLSRIHDYSYDAYVKLVITDLAKNQDSVDAVFLITETETTAYWEQPDRYQEVITARRQSSNLSAEENLVSVGQIVNFNRDRIDLQKYSVVSPTADDALHHYTYYLVDSLTVNGRKAFRLAIVPNTDGAPLFAGMIDIADSTYDVLTIDVGVNEAVRFDFFGNLRYRQRLRDYGQDHWMPSEIAFSGEVRFGIPIPGIPRQLRFQHTASLSDFRFDEGNMPSTLDQFVVVVDDRADNLDSAAWNDRRATSLSLVEQRAYARIDSASNAPLTFGRRVAGVAQLAVLLATDPNFFHFNRTESAYLGAGWVFREFTPSVTLPVKLGYSFGREKWQYQFGAQFRISADRGLWVGGAYRNDVVRSPAIVSSSYNPTFIALVVKLDPLDYYHEQGFTAFVSGRITNHSRLELRYNEFDQKKIPLVTDYSIFNFKEIIRENPPIVDGRLRSLSATVMYDSRPMLRQQGRDYRFNSLTYTRVSAGVEYANPDLVPNDFAFGRYFVGVRRRQRTFNWGLTTIDAYAGVSSGHLPTQRYFNVDYGKGAFFEEGGFSTMHETNFYGNRAAMIVVSHNFDRMLFQKSGIPLIKKIPFTLAVHTGWFWTDFVDHDRNPGDELLARAPRAYSEVGFGIGNLTPFLSPLNLAVYFSWQLSSYATEGVQFRVGVPTP